MAYDFHGGWSGITGHSTAMYHDPDYPDSNEHNIEAGLQLWAEVPKNKVVLGLVSYGRKWEGVSEEYATAPTASVLTYTDIMADYFGSPGVTYKWNGIAKASYLTSKDPPYFISYDSVQAIQEKVRYAAQNRLGGIFHWESSLDRDGELVRRSREAWIMWYLQNVS